MQNALFAYKSTSRLCLQGIIPNFGISKHNSPQSTDSCGKTFSTSRKHSKPVSLH